MQTWSHYFLVSFLLAYSKIRRGTVICVQDVSARQLFFERQFTRDQFGYHVTATLQLCGIDVLIISTYDISESMCW